MEILAESLNTTSSKNTVMIGARASKVLRIFIASPMKWVVVVKMPAIIRRGLGKLVRPI